MKKKEARVIEDARALVVKMKNLEDAGHPLIAEGQDSAWTLRGGYPAEFSQLAASLDELDKKKKDYVPLFEEYFTPNELANELGITPKKLRRWLRNNLKRPVDLKNTPWLISQSAADEIRKAFGKDENVAQEA